jgi:hypothetical protein
VHRVTEFTGSNDGGRTWRAYEFFHYPQQLDRMSGFIAPHFPRFEGTLQIVLATRPEPHSIYAIVAGHLLAQNPEIVRLFRENPFPDRPPQMIRLATYRYRFTDLETYRTTGNFWRREYEGDYLPMIYLNERQEIVRAESEIAVTRIKAHYQNPDAQNRLGLHLVNGELGLSRDPVQAAGWFRRAAEQGLADGQFNLSLFLLNGDGARPDPALSAPLPERGRHRERGRACSVCMQRRRCGRRWQRRWQRRCGGQRWCRRRACDPRRQHVAVGSRRQHALVRWRSRWRSR